MSDKLTFRQCIAAVAVTLTVALAICANDSQNALAACYRQCDTDATCQACDETQALAMVPASLPLQATADDCGE